MRHRSKFLVIVDDSIELSVAIRFAAQRAKNTKGGIILLNIIEQFDPQQWQSVEEIIEDENLSSIKSNITSLKNDDYFFSRSRFIADFIEERF